MAAQILIIGAGPAGLACAMELSRAHRSAIVIEKDPQVGGLAKTLTFREGDDVFRTDIGPHRFFSKNEYLYDFIDDLIHEEWKLVARHTRQFIDGKFYDYPINVLQVVKNIGPRKSAAIALDYAAAAIRYQLLGREIVTFEDYLVAHFGRTLAAFSMINYTEKVWGIPAGAIHPEWARQRIRDLNLLSVLKRAALLDCANSSLTGGPILLSPTRHRADLCDDCPLSGTERHADPYRQLPDRNSPCRPTHSGGGTADPRREERHPPRRRG